MQIINLTPHDITILNEDKEIVEIISKSNKVARLDSEKKLINTQGGDFSNHLIPFFITKYGAPYLSKTNEKGEETKRIQFPEQKEGIVYIVSALFRSDYNRSDFWQPGELVRNSKGQPIGCIGLSQ